MDVKHDTDRRIARNVRTGIAGKGLTQGEVARVALMNESGLSRCLTGSRQWRVDEVYRIATLLGKSMEELVK